ncbi:hypothetical protein TRICI_003632 [Trichomonascus ciferrii]|uniref:Large ribosomal subunit protein bL32m n=1 Tax=Trichomonascus ciferrii TaxID=44093 RepID=A0A642V9E0_9ASCO|nr:hypothetical protein TRICI_003632 [Trichomonascus ciferrii]
MSVSSSVSGLLPRLGEALGRVLPPIGGGISIRLPLPTGKDDGLVNAVPKKKTSHRKKRQRQLAGKKQIHPLNNLNRCPSCGNYKRAHTLCMHCVSQIQRLWRQRDQQEAEAKRDPGSVYNEDQLDEVDKRILYPGKHESDYEKKLKERHEYILSRPRTLPVNRTPKAPKVTRPRE